MPRTPRHDQPNQLHHIYDRTTRRQVLFADRRDYRRFLAILACSVRRGEIEVAAYSLMGTHFHLVARSPAGDISYAMMRILNTYSRYRNRRQDNDGPGFRARFESKPVTSMLYFVTLIRYVDHNPVTAGLCARPFEYPYGSARLFAAGRHPRWFDRSIIDEYMFDGPGRLTATKYAAHFGSPIRPEELEVIKARLAKPGVLEDELDKLYASPPEYIARWMVEKIRAAGGRSPWTPIASRTAVLAASDRLRAEIGDWEVRPNGKAWDVWPILKSGLLRTLACSSLKEIASAIGGHTSTATRRNRRHAELMLSNATYAARAGEIARAALDLTYGKR